MNQESLLLKPRITPRIAAVSLGVKFVLKGKRKLQRLRGCIARVCCDWCPFRVNAEVVKHTIAIRALKWVL